MNYEEKIYELNETLSTYENELDNIIEKTVLTGLRQDVELVDSNVGYLGFIPSHWNLEKVKYHLSRKSDKNHPDAEVLSLYRELGVIPKNSRDDNHNVTSEDTSKYQFVKMGDFVINKMKAWQGSMAVSGYEGIVSPAYYIYDFKDDTFDRNYFHYLIRNKALTTEFRRLSGGIREGQWDLPEEAMNNLLLPVPPIEEQREIAEYLDKKCAEIDDVIGDIKAQIETLKNMKQSCITEVITKGLNRTTEYRDSGVVWIGQIPKNWVAEKLKYGLQCNDGGVWGDDPTELGLNKIVLRSTEQTIDGKWNIEDPALRNLASVTFQPYRISLNDLLITKSSGSSLHIGKTTLADSYFINNECYYSNFLQRLRVNNILIPKFLWYLMNNTIVREQFIWMQNSTIGIGNINSDNINNVYIPVPPIEEQREIAEYLDKKCAEIDDVIGDKEKQLDVLEEYKKSLIFEVVTGKRGV